jgi:hypothetical protein
MHRIPLTPWLGNSNRFVFNVELNRTSLYWGQKGTNNKEWKEDYTKKGDDNQTKFKLREHS